jgi:hypothetical protein
MAWGPDTGRRSNVAYTSTMHVNIWMGGWAAACVFFLLFLVAEARVGICPQAECASLGEGCIADETMPC